MPNQNNIIKDGKVCADNWIIIDSHAVTNTAQNENIIIPLSDWSTFTSSNKTTTQNLGVLIENDVDLNNLDESLFSLPLIAINFPSFMDGRGFSLARLLRERFNYKGEIRAVGHFIRDQLYYLKRCGFNSFRFNDDTNLSEAVLSLNDFSEAYQTSIDIPTPLFRRRNT